MSAAPLDGLRVLELGHWIAAPLAGVFLADQGADVVRVQRPDPFSWDPVAEQSLARGKRTLIADLTDRQQHARVLALAQECDVLLDGFRGGVLDRLGLGHQAVAASNPSVVYVSLPGYARRDPRSGQPAWDATISAGCGLFTDLSVAGAGFDLPPTYTALPLPSVYAGLWGAIAAAAALHARARTGHGDHIEVPLADAAMSAAAGVLFGVEGQPARYNVPPLPRALLDRLSLRRAPRPLARLVHDRIEKAMPAFFRSYVCQDGQRVFLCALDNANQIEKLLDATGLRDEVEQLGLQAGPVLGLPASRTNRNAYRGDTPTWARLRRLLADRFAGEPAEVWAQRLAQAGVPAVRERSTAEWVTDPVMHDSGVLLRAPATDGSGDVVQPAPQVDVTGSGVATAMPDGLPDPGQPDGWSQPRAFAPPTPRAGHTTDPPLTGVRVLDLANVIAGPAAGRTLAELGADVTHVSAVEPRMGPRMTLLLGLEVNQGKRSAALDLRSPGGQKALGRLVDTTDVVLYNKPPGAGSRLGVSPAQVHTRNPDAVVCAVTAYSGLHAGGWEDRPAYDPVVQALTGVMRRFGGDRAPAVHGIASCIDYFTGYAAAYGALVALLARNRGATHLTARTSLVRTAAWVQFPFVARPDGREPSGLAAQGPHGFDRLYRVRGGWVHLAAPPDRLHQVRAAATASLAIGPTELEAAVVAHLRRLDPARAAAWAASIGATCADVRSARSLRRDALIAPDDPAIVPDLPSGRLLRVRHPDGDVMWLTEPGWLRPAHAFRRRLAPAPRPGHHTRAVLTDAGFGPDEIDELLASRAATTRWATGAAYVPA